jgi:tetratricopeptide (TPR) repeat protein
MNLKPSVGPTTEPFPGEDIGLELGLLCDALDLLTGSAFLFAVCEEGPLRERLVEQVRDHLEAEGQRGLISVEFSPDKPDLAGQLASRLSTDAISNESNASLIPVVFVSIRGMADAGMNVANLAEDQPDRLRVEQSRRAWRSLNIRRERLSHLNVPLVFWLNQNALGQLMQHAADVFAARSQIFLFETRLPEPDTMPPMRSEAMVDLLDRFHRTLLPPDELRKRARLYEQRLERQRAAAEPNWAGIAFLCRDLAAIYRELDDYERAGSFQDEAIEAYLTAIARSDEGDQNRNQDWAPLQVWLGLAYKERLRGDRTGNLEQAIVHYQQALEVRTRQAFPEQWAGTQNNLGTAFADRLQGDRAGNLEQAIVHYQQALEVYTRQAFPAQWAKTRYNLGLALLDQGQLHQERQDFEAAERSLTEALHLFQELNDADQIAAAQEALGRLALQTARPAEAQTLLKEARQQYAALEQPERVEAIDELLGQVEEGE